MNDLRRNLVLRESDALKWEQHEHLCCLLFRERNCSVSLSIILEPIVAPKNSSRIEEGSDEQR